ncbi:MAG: hypothetical protein DME59_21485, partial [Verrucomicrobia bacterium]
NLRFLEQEVAFKRVTAPFAGIITIRNVNVGDLITANNTSFEMFHILQTDPLRVYFRIPQTESQNIAVGQIFDVQLSAQSAETYPGKVIATSEAVSPGLPRFPNDACRVTGRKFEERDSAWQLRHRPCARGCFRKAGYFT